MPVVQKIKKYIVEEQEDEERQYDLENDFMRLWSIIQYTLRCVNIEMVFESVIQFIKWHNIISNEK
jgi:hypothetical protein